MGTRFSCRRIVLIVLWACVPAFGGCIGTKQGELQRIPTTGTSDPAPVVQRDVTHSSGPTTAQSEPVNRNQLADHTTAVAQEKEGLSASATVPQVAVSKVAVSKVAVPQVAAPQVAAPEVVVANVAVAGEVPASLSPTVPSAEPITIDLPTALLQVGGQNPRIALAAARYREAYARMSAAYLLWLPSIRAGVSFNNHDGNLQASDGNIVDVDRSSLQAGLGIRAIGAGTPTVPGVVAEFHTSDALFQPHIEAHAAHARQAAIRSTTNDTLLAVALAHLELLRTAQQIRITEQTRDDAQQLAQLTDDFADSGQGPQADADRAQTELVLRRNEVSRANEARRVASARLAEVLSLDPLVEILPQEATVVPVQLVPHETPSAELIATGLSNRPELAEAQQLVCEAVNRYRRERFAPLLPSVLLGISQSQFGGGLGSDVADVRRRFDFDAAVFWELRNLGFGDWARGVEQQARHDQALARQAAMLDRVAREVVEASQQVRFRWEQIEIAQSGVQYATDSYQRNLDRIREGQGLPIEVLQSIQALDEARREYLRSIVDYNESQFRLQRAIGWPVQLVQQ